MNDISCGIRIWVQVSFVLSQSRSFDRRTDRRTERPWQYRALHYMQSHGRPNSEVIVSSHRLIRYTDTTDL